MRVFTEEFPSYHYLDTEQPPLNVKLQLLTKDNVVVYGPWKGEPLGQNKTYKAWAGLCKRDKDLELKLGHR